MTTHALMVIDMSGSMGYDRTMPGEVRGGFNGYIAQLRRDVPDCRVTATLFDTHFIDLCIDAPLREVPELTEDNYKPRGGTALRLAVGKTIDDFEEHTDLAPEDRVILVVQTDGHENSSGEAYPWPTLKKMIEDREAGGQWTTIYLGVGPGAWNDQAQQMGVALGNTINTEYSAGATRSTYSGLANATRVFSQGASAAETVGAIRDAVNEESNSKD